MKKKILISVLGMLCTYVTGFPQANIPIRPLNPGDQLPAITITNLINYTTKEGKPATSVHLSEFSDRLLIIDFWATWCAPCIAMLPKMDSLQQQFGKQVQLLPVTYQSAAEVSAFLRRMHISATHLPDAVSDKTLAKYFPHTYLPHYVWIHKGTVKYITGYEALSAANISAVLNGKEIILTEKTDPDELSYDPAQPLFSNGNGGAGQSIRYRSLLAGYTEGLPSGYQLQTDPRDETKVTRISATNLPLTGLYSLAWSENKRYFGNNRVLISVKDSSALLPPQGAPLRPWMQQHTYSYEIQVPEALSRQSYAIMQQDLARNFPAYQAKVEKRRRPVLALIRTSDTDRIRSKGGKAEFTADAAGMHIRNSPLSGLTGRLNVIYLQRSPRPVIDQTGYTVNVDLDLNARPSHVDELNRALAPYGLALVETEAEIDVLVITDQQPEP